MIRPDVHLIEDVSSLRIPYAFLQERIRIKQPIEGC